MPDVFAAYSRYYDLLYSEKDYEGEVRYIQGLIETFDGGRQILEFGSGTGKHAGLLSSRGYSVTGVERSAEMIARAQRVSGVELVQGDARTVSLGRRFDVVLALFHVVSYQTSNDDIGALFDRAAEHLLPGGLFIFDFWYSPAVYSQRPAIRIKRLSDNNVDITRIAEPILHSGRNCVDVVYTMFITDRASGRTQMCNEIHSMRHLSLPEINLLAGRVGMTVLRAEEFGTGNPASESTWGVCVTLRKE